MSARRRDRDPRTDEGHSPTGNGTSDAPVEAAQAEASMGDIELANEYAMVRVRKVQTGNGVRLEIEAPRLGRAIRLCPLELESLTWQSHEVFSRFLETPFGPEHEGK